MHFVRQQMFLLAVAAMLVFSTVMAVRQRLQNSSRHVEQREAFIFLQKHGYDTEAERLYTRLLLSLPDEPTRHLVDDIARTSNIAPTNQSPVTNILVRFHIAVKRELEKRFEEQYLKARKAAEASS